MPTPRYRLSPSQARQSSADEHCITPDIYGTRYYLDSPLGKIEHPTPIMIVRKSGTGLLRTCKQVNEEATEILYGANIFTFAETMHPVPGGLWSYGQLPLRQPQDIRSMYQ